MKVTIGPGNFTDEFSRRVAELSGQDLQACYQCGKCTAGCISASVMDVPPHLAIRMAWLGMQEELRQANTPWLCAACLTCDLRCPKGIDISRIMEALRVIFHHPRQEGDYVDPASLPPDMLARMPQQALVAGLRKYTK